MVLLTLLGQSKRDWPAAEERQKHESGKSGGIRQSWVKAIPILRCELDQAVDESHDRACGGFDVDCSNETQGLPRPSAKGANTSTPIPCS